MIVIEAVMQTEVFVNDSNTVSIRQTDGGEEWIVVIPPDRVNAICAALRRAAKDAKDAPEQ